MNQARQGDVLFTKIDALPEGTKKLKTSVIVEGEATGHSHQLVGGDIFQKGNDLYLVLPKEGKVTHQEHDTIPLGKGVWAVTRQREYLSKDMVKIVTD